MQACGSAIILCGGRSSRMGFDKSRIKIGDKFLVELIAEKLSKIFNEIILVVGDKNKFNSFGYRVVEDARKGCGPAGGIYTGLVAASSKYVFVTACDMPIVNLDYIKFMIGIVKSCSPDCVISKNGKWIEPFYSFYSKAMISTFNKSINNNNFKLFEIIRGHNIHYIEEDKVRSYSKDLEVFINLNYSNDIDILKKIYVQEVKTYEEYKPD